MDDESRRTCLHLLHADYSGIVHCVYRTLLLLRSIWWSAHLDGNLRGQTVCGIVFEEPVPPVNVDCTTCMACMVMSEVDLLLLDVAAVKADYAHACGLVSDMHAAAMGVTGGGAHRGVVADIEDLRADRDA